MKNEEVKFPPILVDEKLEIAYIGMLHNNPKAIAMFYLDIKECQFTVPKMMDLYKLILFREGQAYASEAAKAGFSFPKVTEEIPQLIKVCKDYANTLKGITIDDVYVKIKKLFLLKKAYAYAPTDSIQRKVIDIRNYQRYEQMTIEEIETRINSLSFLSSMNECVINQGETNFLLTGNNNLTTGIDLPFPIMTKTFKGLRKGETMSFAMPSNSGKSRFVCNVIAYLTFVQKKKVLLISNEMTEDKMRLCLITTIVNSPDIQKLHGQVLKKREAELLALKFRPDEGKDVELDENGFILQHENESREDFLKKLKENSEEFRKTVIATDWVSNFVDSAIHFVHTADHTNDELRNIILDYYYKEGIEYYFYDTLKTDIDNIGNLEELKKTATVLSNLAQKFNLFIGSTLQLAESSTPPLSMNINDIAGSRTVKEVLDNLCLIKEINNTTYDKYEYSSASNEDDLDHYCDLEPPDVSNTKYYACVVDKNRAGSKPRLVFRLNLDYNYWEEKGYLRLKQE